MSKLVNDLKEKISGSRIFMVLSTKNYLNSLRNYDGDILTQINIARELNKPFFIIIDSRMSQGEIEETRKYFSKDNVIKEVIVDIGSNNSAMIVASEIRQIMRCMYLCGDKTISIASLCDDEKNE